MIFFCFLNQNKNPKVVIQKFQIIKQLKCFSLNKIKLKKLYKIHELTNSILNPTTKTNISQLIKENKEKCNLNLRDQNKQTLKVHTKFIKTKKKSKFVMVGVLTKIALFDY